MSIRTEGFMADKLSPQPTNRMPDALTKIASLYHKELPLITKTPLLFEKYCPFVPTSYQGDSASFVVGNVRVTVGQERTGRPMGVLRLRTHKILFHVLIKLWEVLDYPDKVEFNIIDLLEFLKKSTGGKSYLNLMSYIKDLQKISIQFEDIATGQIISNLTILSEAVFWNRKEKDKHQLELFHAYYQFHSYFQKVFKEYTKLVPMRLDQLLKLKTDIGIRLYSLLSIVTHSGSYQRTLTNLLIDLHLSSKYNGKYERKRKLEKGIKEVNNKILANKKRIKCRIELTKDKKDYKIVAYQETLGEAMKAQMEDPTINDLKHIHMMKAIKKPLPARKSQKKMPEEVSNILKKMMGES